MVRAGCILFWWRMARAKRPLSPEEQRLWDLATGGIERRSPEGPPAAKPPARAKPAAKKPKPAGKAPAQSAPTAARPAPKPPAFEVQRTRRSRVPGLDRRNAERLRKGQMTIDARLDLHGMTQAEAHRALGRFLAASAKAGRRCLLVITGKGSRTPDQDAVIPGRAGVLRDSVPRWLAEPANRALVVAAQQAAPQHGGGGALYVLLRRRRD